MAKAKTSPKAETKKEPNQPDYQMVVNLPWADILTFVSGDRRVGDFQLEDGKVIRVVFNPTDGGVPMDVKLIDMMADRYTKLAEKMKVAVDKIEDKE